MRYIGVFDGNLSIEEDMLLGGMLSVLASDKYRAYIY